MAQSTEFPELRFVPPRAWNVGRVAGQPTVVVIHDTEGSEGKTSAEDGAAYDQRRTDGTSTHFFVDADTCVQCVLTKDRANHAKATGNKIGIGFELCGKASQTQAQWKDGGLDLRLAAKYVAKCCKKYGIPVRRLTVSQLQAGQKGICGHVDITNAFHESTHTDPGPNFPWTEFLSMVQDEMEDGVSQQDVLDAMAKLGYTQRLAAILENAGRIAADEQRQLDSTDTVWPKDGSIQAADPLPLGTVTRMKAIEDDLVALKATVAQIAETPPGSVVIDQAVLEAALRNVLGSVDNPPSP